MTLGRILRAAVFLAAGGAFALLSAAALAAPWGFWMPDLTPVPLFCFLIHRPGHVPMAAVFLLGLYADLLFGRHPGVGAMTLLVVGEAARWWFRGSLADRLPGRAALVLAGFLLHAGLLSLPGWASGASVFPELLRQAFLAAAFYFPSACLLRHAMRIGPQRERALVP